MRITATMLREFRGGLLKEGTLWYLRVEFGKAQVERESTQAEGTT